MKTEDERNGNHEEHEEGEESTHEGHEESESMDNWFDGRGRTSGMRLPSPLSPDEEAVVSETIGAAISVHRALGPGLLESIYQRALCIELQRRQLAFEVECSVRIRYRDVDLPDQRIDLIVGGIVVVELKSVKRLDEVHRAQLISYLRAAKLRVGLLINFRVPRLRMGLKRVVL